MYTVLDCSLLMFFLDIIYPTHYGTWLVISLHINDNAALLLKFVKICNCFWIGSTSTKIGNFTACSYSLFVQKYKPMKRQHILYFHPFPFLQTYTFNISSFVAFSLAAKVSCLSAISTHVDDFD